MKLMKLCVVEQFYDSDGHKTYFYHLSVGIRSLSTMLQSVIELNTANWIIIYIFVADDQGLCQRVNIATRKHFGPAIYLNSQIGGRFPLIDHRLPPKTVPYRPYLSLANFGSSIFAVFTNRTVVNIEFGPLNEVALSFISA